MELRGPDDDLACRPARVLVAGPSGSGKTTLAARIGRSLGIPHVEIDALFHGPGWTPRPSFEADVRALVATPAWVTEWQYGQVRALLADRADLLVWLDLPRRTVLRQVAVRTVRRRAGRVELWNGNVEPPLRTVLTDPEHIVRWAWSTHPLFPRRIGEVRQRHPDLAVVRLRSRRDVRAWVTGPLHRIAGR